MTCFTFMASVVLPCSLPWKNKHDSNITQAAFSRCVFYTQQRSNDSFMTTLIFLLPWCFCAACCNVDFRFFPVGPFLYCSITILKCMKRVIKRTSGSSKHPPPFESPTQVSNPFASHVFIFPATVEAFVQKRLCPTFVWLQTDFWGQKGGGKSV